MKSCLQHAIQAVVLGFACALFSAAHGGTAEVSTRFHRVFPSSKVITESVFRGMYVASTPGAGETPWLVNEDVTLVFDGKWNRVSEHRLIPLPVQVSEQLREELMRSIVWERLVSVRHGSGSRRVVVVTAFDCPYCQELERRLAQISPELDVTLYFVPLTLDGRDPERVQFAARFYCGTDRGAAWVNFMIRRIAPEPVACSAYSDALPLSIIHALFKGTGKTPNLLLEDGSIASRMLAGSNADLKQMLGPFEKSGLRRNVYTEAPRMDIARYRAPLR